MSRSDITFSRVALAAMIGFALMAAPSSGSADRPESPPIFIFHSAFWINLHHFLYQQALSENPALVDRNTDGTPTAELIESIEFYKQFLVSRDLLFDEGMVAAKNSLEDQENNTSLLETVHLPESLANTLRQAAPAYRENWRMQQDRVNQEWIAKVSPLVDRFGGRLVQGMSRIYQTPWPVSAIRVDVTNFASWAGAYTTNNPTRITISSVDPANQGVAALETLFHEASHGISRKLEQAIARECASQKVVLPRKDFWHAVIFYTAGELVRRDFPDYTPYAYQNGLWKRAWPMYVDALERDWRPYLEGKVSFDAAVTTLVKDVGESKR